MVPRSLEEELIPVLLAIQLPHKMLLDTLIGRNLLAIMEGLRGMLLLHIVEILSSITEDPPCKLLDTLEIMVMVTSQLQVLQDTQIKCLLNRERI